MVSIHIAIHITAWFACFFFFKSALRRIIAWVIVQGILLWPGLTIYCSTVGGVMCDEWGMLWFAFPVYIGVPGLIIFALIGYTKSYKGFSKRVRYLTLPLMALLFIVPAYPLVKESIKGYLTKSELKMVADVLAKLKMVTDIKSCQATHLYMKQLKLSEYRTLGLERDVIRCLWRNKLYTSNFDQKIQICGTLDHSLNTECLYTANIMAGFNTVDECKKYLQDDSNPLPQIYCTAYIQSKHNRPSIEEIKNYCSRALSNFEPIPHANNFLFDECVRSYAINSGNQEICSLLDSYEAPKCREDAQEQKIPYGIDPSELW